MLVVHLLTALCRNSTLLVVVLCLFLHRLWPSCVDESSRGSPEEEALKRRVEEAGVEDDGGVKAEDAASGNDNNVFMREVLRASMRTYRVVMRRQSGRMASV